MLKPITVMMSASGSQFAPGIIKCFKDNGEREITVIGGDMSNDPTNKFLVDKFHTVPAAKDPKYVDVLLDICKKEHVDIFVPQMSAELPVLLENIKRFDEAGVRVSMTRNDSLYIANNKLRLFEFMSAHGIPVSRYAIINSIDDFDSAIRKIGYPGKPVCVKLTESSGARGVRIIDDSKSKYEIFAHEKPDSFYISYNDMKKTLEEAEIFPELMVMEYLSGDEYDVDLVAENGKVLYMAGRRNPVMVMSITQESILEKNDEAYSIAEAVVEKLGLDGNIGIDFKFAEDGSCRLLEINPRIDATVSIFAAGGLNLPYLQVKRLMGEELPSVDIKYGTRLKRRYLETFTDASGELINW